MFVFKLIDPRSSWSILFIVGVFLITVSSCKKNKVDNAPAIDQEIMVNIIAEALVLEPAIRELPKNQQDSLGKLAYKHILEEKGYTMTAFKKSMEWLQSDPKRLMVVYEKVMAELTKKEDTFTKKITEEENE